jgi:hypothetical protein
MAHSAALLASQFSLFPGFEPGDSEKPSDPANSFDAKLDRERLSSQMRRVEELMQDGESRTLHEIAVALRKLYPGSHFPEASLSARLRDMRRAGYTVERERRSAKSGLWQYRAVKPEVAA